MKATDARIFYQGVINELKGYIDQTVHYVNSIEIPDKKIKRSILDGDAFLSFRVNNDEKKTMKISASGLRMEVEVDEKILEVENFLKERYNGIILETVQLFYISYKIWLTFRIPFQTLSEEALETHLQSAYSSYRVIENPFAKRNVKEQKEMKEGVERLVIEI